MTRSDMPRRVYEKHGAFYFVTMEQKWVRLAAVRDGLPAMYRALAAINEREATSDRMPAVVGRWLAEKEPDWAEKQIENQRRYAKVIGDAFADFAPGEVTTRDCNEFLLRYRARARTHNAYRTALRQILALAAREGLRDGANPVDNIPTRATPGRKRAVSDAEITTLRAQALRQPRNGKALAHMIDLALLTGMRIGDLIRLRWQDISPDGIRWIEGKKKTPRLIQWSPKLRAAIKACERGDRIGHVLQKEAGGGYRYSGIRSAWVRACERAGIDGLNIHDFRGRAGVDAMDGDESKIKRAQILLGHTTETMTRDYVDGKYAKRTKPAK